MRVMDVVVVVVQWNGALEVYDLRIHDSQKELWIMDDSKAKRQKRKKKKGRRGGRNDPRTNLRFPTRINAPRRSFWIVTRKKKQKNKKKSKRNKQKNKRQECSSRIFTFFGFCFANLSVVLLLLREGTIWNRQIMIFEHGCCQAAAAAHTGVKFLYKKKKSVWLSPSVSTVKKKIIQIANQTKETIFFLELWNFQKQAQKLAQKVLHRQGYVGPFFFPRVERGQSRVSKEWWLKHMMGWLPYFPSCLADKVTAPNHFFLVWLYT